MTKWDELARPPQTALKEITGGRLKGMTDINPQWRYKAMHDAYGPCGEGWKYDVVRIWTESGQDGQIFMFAQVAVQVKNGEHWADSIPGIGGSMLIEKDKYGLHHNDEAPKMAVTDALSVALKMLGVGADIYMGRWDGSKYKDPHVQTITPVKAAVKSAPINDEDMDFLRGIAAELVQVVEVDGAVVKAYDYLTEQNLDNDQKLHLWDILQPNSKTRSALKEEGKLRANAIGQGRSAVSPQPTLKKG